MAHALTSIRDDQVGGGDDPTIAFYDRDPESYARGTLGNDLTGLYRPFLDHVEQGGLILDAGSGSGRDTREFLSRGFRVEAFDASAGMATLASRLTGVDVEVAHFEHWKARPARYDGIWCFASLLHVAESDLADVVARLTRSLRSGAPLFASFKSGDGEIVDEFGRHYTNLDAPRAKRLFDAVAELEVLRVWQGDGPTALGEPTSWTYALARRADR